MMAALKRMTPRNRGTIVNVGSALAYRSVPLQSVYCGAKSAIRGFTDSLRSEIIHDKLDIVLTTVDLPAVNTPQFDWALNKMGRKAKPVAPIYQPEVPARAILFAATHQAAGDLAGLPHRQGDPGQPHRPEADRQVPGQDRLLRAADGPAARAGCAGQPVRAGAGAVRRAWPVRRAVADPQLGDVHRPPPHRLLGGGRGRAGRRAAPARQAAEDLAGGGWAAGRRWSGPGSAARARPAGSAGRQVTSSPSA